MTENTGSPAIPDDIDRAATDLVRMKFADDTDWDWEMYKAISSALLAEREAKPGWLDISTAPKDGSHILAWPCILDGDHRVAAESYWYVHPSVQGWITELIDCNDYDFTPTHWMPIPAEAGAQ